MKKFIGLLTPVALVISSLAFGQTDKLLISSGFFASEDHTGPLSPTDLALTVNYQDWINMNTLPSVTVEATHIELVKDGFSHFNMVSGEFFLKEASEDDFYGYKRQAWQRGISNGLNQVYRIQCGPGNFVFANGRNLTLRLSEALLETYVSSSANNSKGLALSNVYELIDWNHVMKIREGDFTRNCAFIDHSQSHNFGFENLIVIRNRDNRHGYIIRYEPEDGTIKGDYSGKIMVKDLKGNTTKEFDFNNGITSIRENHSASTLRDLGMEYTKVITPYDDYISVEICVSGEYLAKD